jgi:hypothetical protein
MKLERHPSVKRRIQQVASYDLFHIILIIHPAAGHRGPSKHIQ